ncbi:MAG TPA: hypothetical protein VFM60_00095 [Salinimicrobium sp.]|nr:hypothetical protein [Salinimicrobium sp.]
MKNKIKNIVFILIFCCCLPSIDDVRAQTPPPPDTQMSAADVPGEECAGDDPTQPGAPPPGLCLPVNQYLLPLLIVGIALGTYKIHQTEKPEEV